MTLAEYRALPESEGVWELADGELYRMPPPTYDHQNLIDFLVSMINLFQMELVAPIGCAVSGIGIALSDQRSPTPDMVYLRAERAHLIQGSFVEGIPGHCCRGFVHRPGAGFGDQAAVVRRGRHPGILDT